MADSRYERSLQLGLLDRLVDYEPDSRVEAPLSRPESLRRLRQAVKRDLEYLLNTTAMPIEIPEACKEARKSLLTFGLPDIASLSLQNSRDQERLYRSLESSIELYEPRLAKVCVTSNEIIARGQQTVTFHVEAILMIDPSPERIAFDTVLEISKGAYTVKDS